jgi:hypothetical protein
MTISAVELLELNFPLWPEELQQLNDCTGVVNSPSINERYLKYSNGQLSWVAGRPTEIPIGVTGANGATVIDRNNREIHKIILQGDVTSFTVTGWPPTGTFARLILEINNTGPYSILAWPAGTIWADGIIPPLTQGVGGKDLIILCTFDGGTTIYGTVAGYNYR